MLVELDTVVLTRAMPEAGLAAGDVGAIVHAYPDHSTFEVEFVGLTGETIAILTVPADAVRAVRPREIATARQVA